MEEKWIYYNHALISTCWPHEDADLTSLEKMWSIPEKPLFARWTENFDCGYETDFWACILDKPFEPENLKAKRRYEINKGNKNFYCKKLSCEDTSDMYNVYTESLKGYSGRINIQPKRDFMVQWESVIKNPDMLALGVYERDTDLMCGYAHCIKRDIYIPISSFKTMVSKERDGVNFALMYGICDFYKNDLANGSYLCDGWRNVLHDTNFQGWLEKYFQFRKAYCTLHIQYRGCLKYLIPFLCRHRTFVEKIIPKRFKKTAEAVFNMQEWSV